ncbi:MAG: Crp/Fnr family transcriptional regulator [Alphaproteobacteria bacterium]
MAMDHATLDNIAILRELDAEDRRTLARRCAWRRFAAGQSIVTYRDPSRTVFFVVEGRARAKIYAYSGREVAFREIVAGDMFGEFAAIDDAPRSASVEAVTDALVAAMPAEVFRDAVTGHPGVALAMLNRLVGQLRALTERVFEFSTLAVRQRVRAELLRLAETADRGDNTARISPIPTQALIASRISTHREAVAREMSRLANLGIVRRHRGALVVTDLGRLRRMADEVSDPE